MPPTLLFAFISLVFLIWMLFERSTARKRITSAGSENVAGYEAQYYNSNVQAAGIIVLIASGGVGLLTYSLQNSIHNENISQAKAREASTQFSEAVSLLDKPNVSNTAASLVIMRQLISDSPETYANPAKSVARATLINRQQQLQTPTSSFETLSEFHSLLQAYSEFHSVGIAYEISPDRNLDYLDASFLSVRGLHLDGHSGHPTNFAGAQIPNARFFGPHKRHIFDGADLSEAKFMQSDVSNSSFVRTNLDGASFVGADLTDADFTGASLVGSRLAGAKMHCTNLRGADLTGALVDVATLRTAYIAPETKLPT